MGLVSFVSFMSFLGPIHFLNFLRLCVFLPLQKRMSHCGRNRYVIAFWGQVSPIKEGSPFIWIWSWFKSGHDVQGNIADEPLPPKWWGSYTESFLIAETFVCKRKATFILWKLMLFFWVWSVLFGKAYLHTMKMFLIGKHTLLSLLSFLIGLYYLSLSTSQLYFILSLFLSLFFAPSLFALKRNHSTMCLFMLNCAITMTV